MANEYLSVIMPYSDYKKACDAIRERTGSTNLIKSGDLETMINSISGAGAGPEEYQRVEYIQSTTNCKIITDIIADNNTGMELIASYPTLADKVPMGSRADSSNTRFYVPYPLSANTMYHGFNTGLSNSTSNKANVIYCSQLNFLNNRVSSSKEYNTNAAKHAVKLTETLTQQVCPIGIFCYLSGVNATIASSRDIVFYSARISQDGEIIREYIPCYRKSDGEIGLYEKFTKQFLVNEGTGTFTKGPDIEW